MEVDKQTHGNVQQAKMREQLGLVNRMQCFFALQFDDDPALHDKICPKTAVELHRLVYEWNWLLAFDSQAQLFHFVRQTSLVS